MGWIVGILLVTVGGVYLFRTGYLLRLTGRINRPYYGRVFGRRKWIANMTQEDGTLRDDAVPGGWRWVFWPETVTLYWLINRVFGSALIVLGILTMALL